MARRANIAGLLGGYWLMEPAALSAMQAALSRLDWPAHIAAWEASEGEDAPPVPYEARDGVAVLALTGHMTKRGDSMGGAATKAVRAAARRAMGDARVSRVLLVVDSPGGHVDGTEALARDVAALNAVKPVTAYVDGMACSAAYWVASQASRIVAEPTAMVGSIGVIAQVVAPTEQAAEQGIDGYRVHVFKTGALKGIGTEPLTDAQAAHVREGVSDIFRAFVGAVASARGMAPEAVAALEAGAYLAPRAMALGLVDAVGTMEDEITRLTEEARVANRTAPGGAKERTMGWKLRIPGAMAVAPDGNEQAVETVTLDADMTATTTEAKHPVALAAEQAGITTEAAFRDLLAARDFRARRTDEARDEAKRLAVIAMGDAAASQEAAIAAADYEGARSLAATYTAMAKERGIPLDGDGTRQTAAVPPPVRRAAITEPDPDEEARRQQAKALDPGTIYARVNGAHGG